MKMKRTILIGACLFGAFAAAMKANGILPSIGHTDATWADCDAAFRNGANHITHFYSCMSTISRIRARRVAGVLERLPS